ncbi:helix-turn-helix transcriptional regulator [Sporosarcina ureae]|uniref:helix-turn-helix transcriptional regulator n=1 Tax=Sporosarcina ureae TaxID=1571 RepID=UPI0028AB016E|nr:HTH domain-containing protein [Sporosarcina ureae]
MRSRQFELLLYLLKVKKATHKELSDTFEVSTKTIQRDIDKLSMMGVPVICKQGNQGGIYVEESYKLTSSFLTNEDLQTITFALSMYDSISMKKHKDSVLNKLSLIAPDLVHLYENDAEDYLVVDLVEEKIDMTESVYKKINHCLNEELCLWIEVSGEQLVVAPISYVLRPEGLYLYVFVKEYLLIKISNIRYSETTTIEFERNMIPYKNNNHITLK